jgi:flagellar basal body-associated protein FliL
LLCLKRMAEGSKDPSKDRAAHGRGGLIVLSVLAVLAMAGFWFWVSRGGDLGAAPANETRVKSTVHLETFVLNLADPDQRAYLRVGIDLGLNHELKHGEDPVPVAQVRDTILGVLGEAKVDDLVTAQAKMRLKETLLHALQQRVPEAGVEEIYFTEFLIQR